jgi:predicted Zn-dependent protease
MTRKALAALLLAASVGLAQPGPAAAQDRGGGLLGMSPEEEARLGEQENAKVAAEFGGPYKDEKLQAYITSVGERLHAATPIRDQKLTFTLLDSDIINAFSIPGYVYVSRGLLAYARDEAELAGVLGHEIGHIVAHHTAQRYQRTQMASVLGGLAQIAGGLLGGYLGGNTGAQLGAQVTGTGAGLFGTYVLQGYSREQEFEADQLGIRFLEAAGYEPRAMESFLEQLEANEQLEAKEGQAANVPTWLRDHPRTPDRVLAASQAAAKASPNAREQGRERFLTQIDGLVYGDDPAQGFVRGRTFEHPELRFRFTAPEGFTLRNSPAAVIGQDGQGRVMQFTMTQGRAGDPSAYLANEWGSKAGVRDVRSFRAGSLEAADGIAQVRVNDQPTEALMVAIAGEGGTFYRLVFADMRNGLSRQDVADFEASAKTLQRLAPNEVNGIKPLRVQIHTVRSGETQESLGQKMAVDKLPLDTFRVINGLKPDDRLQPGDAVKLVVRG